MTANLGAIVEHGGTGRPSAEDETFVAQGVSYAKNSMSGYVVVPTGTPWMSVAFCGMVWMTRYTLFLQSQCAYA